MELNRNQFCLIGLVLILLGLQLRFVDTYVLNESSTKFLARQAGKTETTSMWTLPVSLATQNGMAPRKDSAAPLAGLGADLSRRRVRPAQPGDEKTGA